MPAFERSHAPGGPWPGQNRRMVLRWLLAVLVVLTFVGLYANEHWTPRTLVIDGRSAGQHLTVYSDAGEGGDSVAELLPDRGQGPAMRCLLRASYRWPFCELVVQFGGEGLDLNRFSRVRLWLHAQGPTLNSRPDQVRVFLRNYNPAYSGQGSEPDLKPHEVVLTPGGRAMPIELRLAQFVVATWWAQSHQLPDELQGAELDRVRIFSISTGGEAAPGEHLIGLERAELVGNWIAPERFRLGLVGLWMFSLLAYLVWESWHMRSRLQASLTRSQALETLVQRDPLTRVANRDGLYHALELLHQVQGEEAFPLAVVFIDVDRFKRINDEHGHDVGDQVLVQLARTLRANLPRDDLLARWGGEEFVIVMPQTTATEAAGVAERLRLALAQAEWPAGLAVTASWGVAQADDEAGIDIAMRAADQAMYRAKAAGRDRVASAAA